MSSDAASSRPDYPLERASYYGQFIGGILIGINIWVFIQSATFLSKGTYSSARRWALTGYSLALVLLLVAAWIAQGWMGTLMWINLRKALPSGASTYLRTRSTPKLMALGSVMVADLMSNLLMLYRCFFILSSRMWVIVFPSMLLVTATVLGILTVVEGLRPHATFFIGKSLTYGIYWVSLTVSFNVLITLLICGRLLSSYFSLRRIGGTALARERLGVIAILVESAFPFSACGVVMAVLYGIGSPAAVGSAEVWGVIVGLSPQLIILRVAMGRAVTSETLMVVPPHRSSKARGATSSIYFNSNEVDS